MMNQAPRGSLSWLRLIAALPLFAGLLVAFGATARPISPDPQGPDQAQTVQEDPNTITVVIKNNDPANVTVNGETVALENLAAYIESLGLEQTRITVNLVVDPETRFGSVDDVRQQLRKARALKLNYRLPGQTEGLTRHLAPASNTQIPKGPTVVPPEEAFKGVDRNDIFVVKLNSNDRMFAGTDVCDSDQELLRRIKEFIRERGAKSIISLGADRGTSYSKFYTTQATLRQAYDEIRDEEAHSRYGKAFEELDDAERDAIYQAIPINISEAELRNRPQPAKR